MASTAAEKCILTALQPGKGQQSIKVFMASGKAGEEAAGVKRKRMEDDPDVAR